MDSLNRSHSLSKHPRSRRESSSRLTPNMAAAMLSLRWPPPENPRDENEYDSDIDNRMSQPGASKNSSSRKLYQKKSKASTNDKRKPSEKDDEPLEYEPVTIPEFNEVQTAWPGFDHEPVPNWEQKYMIAKPYPKTVADISSKSSHINYGSNASFVNSKEITLKKDSKPRSKSRVIGEVQQSFDSPVDTNMNRPTRIIRVERVGSCIK